MSGVETEVDAEEGHQGHARNHCARGFLGAESAIDVEKSVERNTGVDEHPGRGHLKSEPCPKVVLLFRGGSDEGLLMKPHVKGTAEIENAPMIVIIVVIGMDLYSPPNSVHLLLPVR